MTGWHLGTSWLGPDGDRAVDEVNGHSDGLTLGVRLLPKALSGIGIRCARLLAHGPATLYGALQHGSRLAPTADPDAVDHKQPAVHAVFRCAEADRDDIQTVEVWPAKGDVRRIGHWQGHSLVESGIGKARELAAAHQGAPQAASVIHGCAVWHTGEGTHITEELTVADSTHLGVIAISVVVGRGVAHIKGHGTTHHRDVRAIGVRDACVEHPPAPTRREPPQRARGRAQIERPGHNVP